MTGIEFFKWLAENKNNVVFLDTETSGSWNDPTSEVVELALCDYWGVSLFDSLICASVPISPDAAHVHGIYDVSASPKWSEVLPLFLSVIKDKIVVIYNKEFDMKVLQRSIEKNMSDYSDSWHVYKSVHCAMLNYAVYNAEWIDKYKNFKLKSLAYAVETEVFRASLDESVFFDLPPAHRAMGDAQRCALVARLVLIP